MSVKLRSAESKGALDVGIRTQASVGLKKGKG